MILTVVHDKGGVGKTTLAWHMTFVLSKVLKKKVKVIDLDSKNTIYHLNNIRVASKQKSLDVIVPKSVKELLDIFKSYKEDVLLVDVGGYDNDLTRTAIKRADKILVPLSDSATEIIGFATFQSILAKLMNPHIYMVFNRMHANRKNFDGLVKDVSGYKNKTFIKTIIRDNRAGYVNPLKVGNSVLDSKKSKCIEDIKRLCNELI